MSAGSVNNDMGVIRFCFIGCQAGTFVTYPLAGYITDELGWEYVFYIMGAASLVWGALWIYLIYDSPDVHPRIDKEELKYLQESIGVVQRRVGSVTCLNNCD